MAAAPVWRLHPGVFTSNMANAPFSPSFVAAPFSSSLYAAQSNLVSGQTHVICFPDRHGHQIFVQSI